MAAPNEVASAERVIAAPPEKIFDLLADPSRHRDIDGSRTVRDAKAGPERLALGEELAPKVLDSYDAARRLAERDQANLDVLRRRLGRTPLIEVPHLEDDVHDLEGLRRMDEYLFG